MLSGIGCHLEAAKPMRTHSMSHISVDYSASAVHNLHPKGRTSEMPIGRHVGQRDHLVQRGGQPTTAISADFLRPYLPAGGHPEERNSHPSHALPSRSDARRRELQVLLLKQCDKVPVVQAIYEFMRDLKRRVRAEGTEAKYRLTLYRLLHWCATQCPPIFLLSELDVCTVRAWLQTVEGAATTRHNEHERLITFLYFCTQQGWVGDNAATRIRNVAVREIEPVPFTVEQYSALLDATCDECTTAETNQGSLQSQRVRAFIKLLRWSGLRVGDAACLARDKLHGEFLWLDEYKHRRCPVKVLLPRDTVEDLRNAPPSRSTNPSYFFWSGRSKRKSEVATWEKTFARVVSKAARMCPRLFLEPNGQPKPAHLSMLRHTFAVEYLLAGMPIEEVSFLMGHSSVLLTQRLYARWYVQPQQRLAASQRAAWTMMDRSVPTRGRRTP
jgi:integrase/recombinase XerD